MGHLFIAALLGTNMPPDGHLQCPLEHVHRRPPGIDETPSIAALFTCRRGRNYFLLKGLAAWQSRYAATRSATSVAAPRAFPKPQVRSADQRCDLSPDHGSRPTEVTLRRTNSPPPEGEDVALVSRNSSLIDPQVKRNPNWSGPQKRDIFAVFLLTLNR